MRTSRVGYIYCVTNLVNGKQYIGQTLRKEGTRWYHHCYAARRGATYALHNAIRKYGESKFKIEVLLACTQPLLNAAEAYLIASYATIAPYGYNLTTGGGQYKVTDRTRKLHSRQMTGRVVSEDAKRNMSAAQFRRFARDGGIQWDAERKADQARRFKGVWFGAAWTENCEAAAERRIGKRLSKVHRDAIAEGQRRRWTRPGQREAQSERSRGRRLSKAHCVEISARMKAAWEDASYRANQTITHSGRTVSMATRRKMSEAQLRRHGRLGFV